VSVLYRGARLLTQDPVLGELIGDVLVVDGRIAEVGPHVGAVPEGTEEIDAHGMVLLPGFVDTHRHLWETMLRSAAAWEDWHGYARIVRAEFGELIEPEDAYAGDLLGMLGALDAGITTVRDESHVQNSPEHTEAVLQALVDSGGRAVFAYGWPSIDTYAWRARDNPRRHPTYIADVVRRGRSAGGDLVTYALMLRGPELSGMTAARQDLAFARSLGLRSSMHIGTGEFGRHHGIAALHREGLLDCDITFVHCCTSSDEELRMIADAGAGASVAAYLELAMPGLGAPATSRLVAAGTRPSLSIDAEPSAPADMFTVMRAALLAESAVQVYTGAAPPFRLTERDVLAFATLQGARDSGLDHEIGSITPGKAADMIAVDLALPGTASAVDAAAAVVNHGHPGAVRDVLVAGRHVKRDGHLVDRTLLGRAVSAAERSRDRLVAARARRLERAATCPPPVRTT
jgi:5-methylthioadenosine/S-adenosylhomocysteine deaminase